MFRGIKTLADKRLRPLSATVLVVLLLFTAIAAGFTRDLIDRQENELLTQRAADVELVIKQLIGQVRSSMAALSSSVTAEGVNTDQFNRSASAFVTGGSVVSVVSITADGKSTVLASAGGNTPNLNVVNDAIYRAIAQQDMVGTNVYMVGDQRRVAFAYANAGFPPQTAIYWESVLQAIGAPTQVESNAFSEVKVAFYASPTQDVSQTILTTTNELPITGRVSNRPIVLGDTAWTIAVSPRQALVGSVTNALPWLVLGVALIGSLLLVFVVEMVLRRRDEALALVDERSFETDSILEAAEDAFISMNLDGRITRWNRKASELFGWSSAEAVGKSAELLLPAESRNETSNELSKFLEQTDGKFTNTRMEFEAIHKSGHKFPVELAIWSVERDGSTALNAFLHDITTRKNTEQELMRAHEQAVQASRLKSEFLANMSHEIRTPMNGVIGMTGLLLRTDLDVEQREYAETVRVSAESLLNVINDILDFSKIEAGRLELESADFNVRNAVEEVAELLADQAHNKGLEIVTKISPNVPLVLRGDGGRLRQVLVNLVSNSVKFTSKGEVLIKCEVESVDQHSVCLRFGVMDTGIGIKTDDKARIFETFTQLDASTTKRFEGTGLGLSIARQLTQLMGGEIGVESEYGKGSEFWFTTCFEPTAYSASEERTVKVDGTRVLVVDDNATNRQILKETLKEWHMQVDVCESPNKVVGLLAEAVENNDPYKLALLDYHMPEIDGLELARIIADDGRFEQTQMILLTSSGERLSQADATAANIVSTLTKPVRHAILQDRIVAALNTGEARPHRIAVHKTGMLASEAFHVLVVEDNIVNQRVASKMLEKLGCTVDVAANGVEAIEAVKQSKYSLVFMDCQMPEKDGYQATREIREMEATLTHRAGKRLPIIAMTASAMQGDREQAIAAGMDDYLAKPVQLHELLKCLEQWAANGVVTVGESDANLANSAAISHDVLDLVQLENLEQLSTQDGPSILLDLVREFEQTAAQYLASMREAVAEGNRDAFCSLVHALKGSSGTLGAKQLMQLCEQVEAEVGSSSDDDLSADVTRIAEMLEITISELEARVHHSAS